MKRASAVLFSTALTLAVALPARAQTGPATAMDGRWHFAVVPYFWFSGMEGSVSMGGLPEVPVEKSFSDIWSDLDIGFQGDFEARRDRWGFATDIVYMNLGASVGEGRPILGELGLEADVRQLVLEGVAFRRVASGGKPENPAYLDVLAGARYFGTSARLRGSRFDSTKRTLDWVDALGGVRFHVPLGSRLGLSARGDVAGLGSDVTWNARADLGVSLSQRWTTGVAWRWNKVDYDKGEGADRKLFDMTYNGPLVFVGYTW
jgi:hypothetical protein